MAAKQQDFSKFFRDKDLVKKYDQNTPTAKITEDTLEIYLAKGGTLEGKTVLDNACGTGVVTKAILARTKDVTIEATDISEIMIEVVKPIAQSAHPAKVNARVMDAQNLTFADDAFDLSITMFGLALFADPVKAMNEIYRTTKQGGTCFVTTWAVIGHRPIAEELIKRVRRPNGKFDKPLEMGGKQMEDPNQFIKFVEKAGFKNCAYELRPAPIVYEGNHAVEDAREMFGKLYRNFITFKDEDEEGRYDEAWREELRGRVVDDKLTFHMTGTIAWGER